MNIIYGGGYNERFSQVIEQMEQLPSGSRILELCFGDTHIAEYCKNNGYRWKGLDLNLKFVKHAQKMGHDASFEDLTLLSELPKANVCILMGSLYHFHPHAPSLLKKISDSSDIMIISEPVLNLSSRKGLVGFFARHSANVGKGDEIFRYDSKSFMTLMEETCKALNRKIAGFKEYKKDVIIKIVKKNGRD